MLDTLHSLFQLNIHELLSQIRKHSLSQLKSKGRPLILSLRESMIRIKSVCNRKKKKP